jgi:transmembrane sensor
VRVTEMDTESGSPAVGPATSDEAAAWFARRRSGEWNANDEAGFSDWLHRDPANAAAWTRYEQLWERLDAVRNDPAVLAMREAALSRSQDSRSWRSRARLGGAIAASLVIVGIIGWQLQDEGRPSSPAGLAPRSVEGPAVAASQVRDAATRVGERSVLALADGSQITLNTSSAVHVDYSGPERRVTLLRGEAYFEVAKDRARPFIVSAASRRVIAVGTAFAVRMQEHQLRVTLVEGRVRIVANPRTTAEGAAAAPAPVELEPGSALIADGDGAARVEQLNAKLATSWRTGRLVFENQPLGEVVAEMNRYSLQQLAIANPALAARRVSGVFDASGGTSFADALEAYGIAHATRVSPTTMTLTERTR